MHFLIVCLAATSALAFELGRDDACALVDCRAGRECVMTNGAPHCQCQATCPDHFAPVCGTDDNSYDSHCLLHRHACLTETPIGIFHKGFCKKAKQVKPKKKPVDDEEPDVCYSAQRDAFLVVVNRHWQETLDSQPWHVAGMTFRESLWGRFYSCDRDRDNYLGTDELLNCTSSAPFRARPEQDQELTRALCVDALIDAADVNRDWRLDFEEFTTMLSPGYRPPQKQCSLEGSKYYDGEDVHVDGNHCVCAVGSWVCTSPPSSKASEKEFGVQEFDNYDDDEYDYDDDDLDDDDDDVDPLDDDYNDLFDDEDDEDDDNLINDKEEEEYIDQLFEEMLEKLRKHRKESHHHNRL
ncbi:follistatin-related protein 1-like [Penaeus chinensis]|uniref:follistatin-related protein 1-like n=1 Tax=Penaeus chinensis TaxID=139456 RepID=UPI001FB71ED5|nr:follistatin-related protein 1-like [Penaeus chinensis]